MIAALTSLVLCATAAPQEADAPGAGADDGWQLLDAVVYQAGDEPITRSEVWLHMQRTRQRLGLSVSTEEEQMELLGRSLESLVTLALEAQAGEDREADPEGTEDRIDRFLEARRQDRPLRDYVDSLAQSGVSAHSELDVNKAGYYQSSFRSQGKVGPRPTRDDYVRPGEQRAYYRRNARSLLGGGASYRFQDLVVTVDQVGGVDAARELAEELRARLAAGEDFGELHDRYGTTHLATRGVTERFGPENPLLQPDVAAFGEEAEVGDVSRVLAITDQRTGRIGGFRILRLYEKTPGTPPPPFETALAQERIREWAAERRDEAWLEYARARLRATAYLWPDPEAGAAEEPAPGSTP